MARTFVTGSDRYETHTALVLTLADGSIVRLATAEFQIGADLYLAQLREGEPVVLSLLPESDRATLKIQNADKVFGQQVINSNALDGAKAVVGMIFKNLDTGIVTYDEKFPGDVIASEVDENEVPINVIADIYGGLIVGETIGATFPFQDPQPIEIRPDPNDLTDPNRGGGFSGGGGGPGDFWRGRLPFQT